jgi:hypothetical protein
MRWANDMLHTNDCSEPTTTKRLAQWYRYFGTRIHVLSTKTQVAYTRYPSDVPPLLMIDAILAFRDCARACSQLGLRLEASEPTTPTHSHTTRESAFLNTSFSRAPRKMSISRCESRTARRIPLILAQPPGTLSVYRVRQRVIYGASVICFRSALAARAGRAWRTIWDV